MSKISVTPIDTDTVENGTLTRRWFRLTGMVFGFSREFDAEVYGLTNDDVLLDADGCPLNEGDGLAIAVRAAIGA